MSRAGRLSGWTPAAYRVDGDERGAPGPYLVVHREDIAVHHDHVALRRDDVDEALAFYTDRLGFEVRADEEFGPGVRWVTVAPPMQDETEIHLQEPHPELHGVEAVFEALYGNRFSLLEPATA